MSYEPDTFTRADVAFKRGKLKQAWELFAEAAHECNSPDKARYIDRRLQRVESAMRYSKRFMRYESLRTGAVRSPKAEIARILGMRSLPYSPSR